MKNKKTNGSILISRLNFAALLLFTCFLGACSVQPVFTRTSEHPIPLPETLKPVVESPHYWWNARFKMVWSEEPDTLDFSSNLFIAHQIISPVIQKHYDRIKLWRFHRRAAKDSAGHQFSFIFYATPESARKIFQQINSNPLSAHLIKEHIVKNIHLGNPDKPEHPDIKDNSDKIWPVTLQKSWPYYIMGVSILWLDLLEQEAIQAELDTTQSVQSQLQQYKQINQAITQLWKSQGKHAFFHHISGIFGYEPLEVQY